MDLFEKATRRKLRFDTETLVGITTEDLWDIPLDELDRRYQKLHKQIEEGEGVSLIQEQKPTRAFLELKMRYEVIKRVIEVRLTDKERAEKAAETKAYKQKLLALREEKQDESLKDLTLEDLDKLIEDAEAE